ncbi:hypothetical protein TB2_007026 [Malus domestica]|uniref:cysteine synthase n=1 Tax=Malus domestica TaxID=3750 RepID=A0A498IKK8_MALDO|nr:hypothetical protein DVH24_002446 [Malus domestica]
MAPVRSTGAVVAVVSVSMALLSLFLYKSKPSSKKTKLSLRSKENHRDGPVGAIGNTPLIRINSLSDATGCEILGKCEFLNPGGSVKDRVAVKIIEEALESGGLAPGGVLTKGSAGSTAISLATVAPAYGCKCHVVIPDDAAIEKNNGLFLGSSSAMNCVGAVRAAQSLGPGHTIVTILCDSRMRHLSKFCSAEYLSQYGLRPSASGLEFLGVA